MSDETTEIEVVTVEVGGNVVQTLDPALTGYIKGSGAGVFTGVVSIPQSDLTLATDLAAVEGLAGTGIAVRTAANTWANRTLVAGTGISITNADGVSGNITIDATGSVGPDLIAIEALATQGLAARTASNTWALRQITGASNRLVVTNGDGVSGNPTLDIDAAYVGQASITTLGTVTTGTWAASFPGSGAVNSTGELGVRVAPNTARSISIGAPSSAGVQLQGVDVQASVPSTASTSFASYRSIATTAAAAFTVTDLVHFYAVGAAKGAGSTITNAYGFRADNTIAVATNNYGYWSNIALATTTWQLYMSGTAPSYFNGPISMGNNAALANMIRVSLTHQDTSATIVTMAIDVTAPSTATAQSSGFLSILRTQAAAFTCATVEHFRADQTILGGGSSVTNSYGFRARNNIAVATNNYGFNSELNLATTTWGFYASGTAQNFFGGPVGIAQNDPVGTNFAYLAVGASATSHPSANAAIRGVNVEYQVPATATSTVAGVRTRLLTINSAFTVANLIHFYADQTVKGAASTLTNVFGFYASNNLVQTASAVTGYYSDINSAAGVRQMNMSGSADCQFGGAVVMSSAPIVEQRVADTYSTSITLSASAGNAHTITATDGVAFTINAPTSPRSGQYLEVTIRNTSGGALGAITWNAAFKMTAFTTPATANSRTIVFRYDGTNWIEVGRTAADIPN